MRLADYHMHTPLCRHASGTPEAYVAAARAANLTEIGISDHNPMPSTFDDWRMDIEELPAYLDWVAAAQEASGTSLRVRLGLEVDWFPGGESWIEKLANMAPWDYFIGSVHYIGRWNFDNPSERHHFATFGIEQAWQSYWELFADAARSGFFHIMGHPDLIKKFGHRPPGDLRRFYEPAIAAVAESGIAIEINTSGLAKEVAEMYPTLEFLELAHQAKIPLTINSDAHVPAHVARNFDQAVTLARKAGYLELATPPFRHFA